MRITGLEQSCLIFSNIRIVPELAPGDQSSSLELEIYPQNFSVPNDKRLHTLDTE